MNPISYLKQKGIKNAFNVLYQYKLDLIEQAILNPFLRKKQLKNIIVIESHNDFDSNGGAFYNYLIENGYNKKYKIVWLLKNPEFVPQSLPQNVEWVPLFKPSFKKNYYFWIAKFFSYDCECKGKLRPDQKAIYLSHGAVALKRPKGYLTLPENIDYCLTTSEFIAPIHAETFGLGVPNSKQVILGYPVHDILYGASCNEIEKVYKGKCKKYILWMPTFRKSKNSDRNDSEREFTYGVPIIENEDILARITSILERYNIVLIIKIHPMQDLNSVGIKDSEYIKILDGTSVKKLNIDNYRLMRDCDALISDYSSASYDFLHLNRPIGYTMDDKSSYKIEFIVEKYEELMAGPEINNAEQFIAFIRDVAEDRDLYREKRMSILNKLFKYHDGNSSKRIADFLGL